MHGSSGLDRRARDVRAVPQGRVGLDGNPVLLAICLELGLLEARVALDLVDIRNHSRLGSDSIKVLDEEV